MKIRPFTADQSEAWDAFARAQPHATVLHERRFLAYHGDRFDDASLVFAKSDGCIAGILPAARDPNDTTIVISHPGATYGGLICAQSETPASIVEMIDAAAAHYHAGGYEKLVWKQPPGHLAGQRQAVFEWALWASGAALMRRELWNLVELDLPARRSKGHKWAARRAAEAGLVVSSSGNVSDIEAFHDLLSENLKARYQTAPVHSAAEMGDLATRLGREAELFLCHDPLGALVAGIWLFHVTGTATHTQYICCSDVGREMFALNCLIEHVIAKARSDGKTTLSFGASTESGGEDINSGLYAFKAGFGRSSAVMDVYELSLSEESRASTFIMRRGRPMTRDD